jgi:hypothetical protein
MDPFRPDPSVRTNQRAFTHFCRSKQPPGYGQPHPSQPAIPSSFYSYGYIPNPNTAAYAQFYQPPYAADMD